MDHHEPTPEEQEERAALMIEFREHLDRHLKRRGTTVEAILDPECFGNRRQKAWVRIKNFFWNLRVALG